MNILTDGPRNEQGQPIGKQEEDLGEDTTNTYLHSAQDRTALMQKLSRNKDSVLPGGAPNGNPGQMGDPSKNGDGGPMSMNYPTSCVVFQGMFDTT